MTRPCRCALDALEALDGQDEDRGTADLDLERVRHEELARLHDRRHRVDDLAARGAVLPNDPEDLLDPVVLHADDDRGVRLLQEPARGLQPRRAVLPLEQGVDERPGVLVVDDGDDELHGREYRSGGVRSGRSHLDRGGPMSDRLPGTSDPAIVDAIRAVARGGDADAVLVELLTVARSVTDGARAIALLWDGPAEALRVAGSAGLDEPDVAAYGTAAGDRSGAIGTAAHDRRPVLDAADPVHP